MSAYVVQDKLIDSILMFVGGRGGYVYGKERHWDMANMSAFKEIGQIIVDANYRAVNARYKEDDKSHKYNFHLCDKVSALQCIKAIQCVQYQLAETDDYRETEAYLILDNIKNSAICKLPGYDACTWG